MTLVKCSRTGRASEVIRVLLLPADPIDSSRDIDEEFRAIDREIDCAVGMSDEIEDRSLATMAWCVFGRILFPPNPSPGFLF